MKTLVEIYQKMNSRSRIKTWIIITVIFLFIAGTVMLIVSDQQKSQKRQFVKYQQEIMERLLQQQAMQPKQMYTEEDFNEAKKSLPPVEEVDFEPK